MLRRPKNSTTHGKRLVSLPACSAASLTLESRFPANRYRFGCARIIPVMSSRRTPGHNFVHYATLAEPIKPHRYKNPDQIRDPRKNPVRIALFPLPGQKTGRPSREGVENGKVFRKGIRTNPDAGHPGQQHRDED